MHYVSNNQQSLKTQHQVAPLIINSVNLLTTREAAYYFGRFCLSVRQTITFESLDVGSSYQQKSVYPGSTRQEDHQFKVK